jgi:sporulation protein YlmC with PRC-barrel domain
MPRRIVRLQRLLGRRVLDPAGRTVGRIEDLRVEPDGEDYVVTEFILGPPGRWSRFRGFLAQLPPLKLFGWGLGRPQFIPWQQIDLSNIKTPRLRPPEKAAPAAGR